MPFIAGHCAAVYTPSVIAAPTGSPIDFMTERGFEHTDELHHQEVNTDEFGEGIVDAIQEGATTMIRFDYVEYDIVEPIMYSSSVKGDPSANVGKRLVDLAGELVLTPKAGTPAADVFTSRTYHKCICVTNIPVLLGSRHRKGPLTFVVFPDIAENDGKTYTDVAPA